VKSKKILACIATSNLAPSSFERRVRSAASFSSERGGRLDQRPQGSPRNHQTDCVILILEDFAPLKSCANFDRTRETLSDIFSVREQGVRNNKNQPKAGNSTKTYCSDLLIVFGRPEFEKRRP
jgi:hypothetical protein